ncbi:MAG TPA: preprotein translocase subunit SecY [Kiritimatiellia bacterium]|nr:preprotein translocase subunit SecY [Kiritimatiellia bacterium]HRU71229.1 preprotein translocase subunit SecY [Kiritimatiellia bacterium]
MAMLESFANTFKIPELRKRILLTAGLVFISRLISMIPTPGVDWQTLQQELARIRETAGAGGGLMDWFNVFSGGALNQCAVGFLSIWPYISASIIIQLLTAVIPSLERMRREGESGRVKLAQITRYLTIGICVFQSFALATALQNPASFGLGGVQIVTRPGFGFNIMTVIAMTTASLLVMWLADQITQRGIGNGTSLIIMINITSRLPVAIIEAWTRYFGLGGITATRSPIELLLLLLFGFLITMGTVMLTQGVRKVPIHSTRRAAGGGNSYGMQQTYMPLRVNYTGVMPIIFAGPLIQFPAAILSRIPAEIRWLGWLKWLGAQLSDMTSPLHLAVYALLIMFFAFFWVATQFNAMQISDNLKREGSYVPGIRPGRATAEYLDALMTRVTLIGGVGLLIIALVPQFLRGMMELPWEMASFFGGTSLLIIVGVALDTLRQMESHLLMRNYDGFLKHGRLRSRR